MTIGNALAARGNIGAGLAVGGGAAAFVGAYDAIPNIAAAYSPRRMFAAYTGKPWRLRRSSDNDEMWSRFLGNGPHLDTAHTADFLNGANGTIVKWASQKGTWIDDNNGTDGYDATQTTAASQPLYVASGQNGRPVGRWDGVNDVLATVNLGISQPTTIFVIGKQTSKATDGRFLDGGQIVDLTAGGAPRFFAGTVRIGSGDYSGAVRVFSAIFNAAASRMWIDGTSRIGPVDAGSLGLGVVRIGWDTAAARLNGDISELIICNAALSDANRGAAEQIANAYFAVY